MTGSSSDVTFTLWGIGQPDDADPSCISTDISGPFPNWRDWDCAKLLPFICQSKKIFTISSNKTIKKA